MTSHANHDHPNTPAARAACRALARATDRNLLDGTPIPAPKYIPTGMIVTRWVMEPDPIKGAPWFTERVYRAELISIAEPHCQSCGNVEDRDMGVWDGYTSCCNELVIRHMNGQRCEPDRCSHDTTDADGRVIEL